jgi:plasmid stabilization system protein ParE
VKHVLRTKSYHDDLDRIEARIVQDNPVAAVDLWLHIDQQVDALADPSFPRRIGQVPDTRELVAHENYIVILQEDDQKVIALNVIHVRQKYPP